MKKRFLPVPLLLLIPVLLLIAVVAAGGYRLSLDDSEIAAKQGRYSQEQADGRDVMRSLFSYEDAKPWQVAVPETMGPDRQCGYRNFSARARLPFGSLASKRSSWG
ncbi:TPA: hypothetical protein P0E24_005152 [Vibrio campbellii]|nr:hypothetical protein [Vibrio campbellii]